MINLIVACAGMMVLQACASVPWLVAIDWRNRRWLRQVKIWGSGLAIAIALGAGWAYFVGASSDGRDLVRWGRFYMSALHLQLAADFFVVVFWLLLKLWPKGGAVALAAFQEGARQPMFWLLFGAALILMLVS